MGAPVRRLGKHEEGKGIEWLALMWETCYADRKRSDFSSAGLD